MVGGTVVVTVVVVYIWLAYFNALLGGVSAPVPYVAPPEGAHEFTFWQTMARGIAVLYGGIIDGIRSLARTLQTPRDYLIQPPH